MDAKCSKCDGNNFELKFVRVKGTENGLHLVVCTNCQSTIGVAETQAVDSQLQTIKNQLSTLANRLDQTSYEQKYTFTSKINELETELANIRYQLSSR